MNQDEFRPLLPEQVAVQEQLDEGDATAAYVCQDPDLKAAQKRAQGIAGLRSILDWYEANPNIPLPQLDQTNYSLDTKEQAAELIKTGGHWEKKYVESAFYLSRDFGTSKLTFMFYRNAVCERKVIGTKVVPAKTTTTVVEEHVEEIVEWVCEPILGESNAKA